MAFFKTKEEIEKAKATKTPEKKAVVKAKKEKKVKKAKKDKRDIVVKKPTKTTTADLSWVLISPRITEKAAYQSEDKVFIFNVHKDANKIQIKGAIEKKFEVTPIKINVAKINSKPTFKKGVKGRTPEGKKAFVYLSKKDSIQFV